MNICAQTQFIKPTFVISRNYNMNIFLYQKIFTNFYYVIFYQIRSNLS